MILRLKDPKHSTIKLWDLINTFIKDAGYKISIKKSVAFLHTNNELSEKEERKIIPFTTDSKIKYLGINLTKNVKELYNKNYKVLAKEIV
jgi:hypothetical protein